MQNFTCTLTLFVLLSLTAAAQLPDDFPAPVVWLRADKGKVTPALWADAAGNDLAATAVGDEGPAVSGMLNYNKALTFDGVNDYMKVPYSLEGLQKLTIIAVFQSSDTTERGVWGAEQAESRNARLTTRRATGPDDAVDVYGNQERRAVLSSIVQHWTEAGALPAHADAYMALGSAGKALDHKPFKGIIAELLVFDTELDYLERVQVETYLGIKYGIPLQAGNYVSATEKVLWHRENNKGYASRITGIGRDDAFRLYQKQSRSAFDIAVDSERTFLAMSAGALAETNEINKAAINAGDFLVWGDNDLPLEGQPCEGTDSLLSFIERKWMLQATGPTVNQLSTELRIDLTLLPSSTFGYWLVIDRSGTGNFDRDNLEYVEASYITNDSVAVFSGLKWDTDRSGKDMFGLAMAKNFYAVVRTLEDPLCDNRTGGKIAIEILGDNPPYRFELKNNTQELTRNWQGRAVPDEQDNLRAGEHTLVIRNAKHEKVVRNFTLVMPDALFIDLGEDRVVAGDQPIALDASTHIPSSTAVSYAWESNFGYFSDEPRIKVTEHGLYKVSVTNEKGCVFTDAVALSGDEHRFEVFPTVVYNDKFSIGISLQEAGSVRVKIVTSAGRLYQEMQGANQSEYLFTGIVKEPGLYVVVLQTPKGMETRKVIIY